MRGMREVGEHSGVFTFRLETTLQIWPIHISERISFVTHVGNSSLKID